MRYPKQIRGSWLNPQPDQFLDCVEDYKTPGKFDFYSGNEMEGHEHIITVMAPNLNVEPEFVFEIQKWIWKSIGSETQLEFILVA